MLGSQCLLPAKLTENGAGGGLSKFRGQEAGECRYVWETEKELGWLHLKRKETGFAAFHFPCFLFQLLIFLLGFGSYKDKEVK